VAKRYALGYLGLSLIGLGSFGFHTTLKWEWQLMDELPMVSCLPLSGCSRVPELKGDDLCGFMDIE
jgi:dihydroceramidase